MTDVYKILIFVDMIIYWFLNDKINTKNEIHKINIEISNKKNARKIYQPNLFSLTCCWTPVGSAILFKHGRF